MARFYVGLVCDDGTEHRVWVDDFNCDALREGNRSELDEPLNVLARLAGRGAEDKSE